MKLYAKVKAHKKQNGKDILVEKGQGTNEYMSVLLNDETGRNLIEIYSEVRENEIYTHVMDYSDGKKIIFSHELPNKKGNKQKGELECPYCGNKTKSMIETGDNNTGGEYRYCKNCHQNF